MDDTDLDGGVAMPPTKQNSNGMSAAAVRGVLLSGMSAAAATMLLWLGHWKFGAFCVAVAVVSAIGTILSTIANLNLLHAVGLDSVEKELKRLATAVEGKKD